MEIAIAFLWGTVKIAGLALVFLLLLYGIIRVIDGLFIESIKEKGKEGAKK